MNIHKTISVMENNHQILEILRFCPFEVLSKFDCRSYTGGQIIFNQGETYDCFCIIINGLADIYITAENGKRYSQAIYKKGDFIGELEVFERRPFVCFVEALTDLELLMLDRKSFLLWLELDKNINTYVMRLMSSQFYKLSKKAGDDNLYSLKYRLCNYFLSYIENQSSQPEEITVKVMKPQLSKQFGVTERSINRILKSLKEKDVLKMNSQSVVIKDVQKLKSELNPGRFEE